MKKRLFTLILLLTTVTSFAQRKMIYQRVEQIGVSSLHYHYRYTHFENGKEEQVSMILQVGSDMQRFGCVRTFFEDSLALVFENKPQDTKVIMKKVAEIGAKEECLDEVSWRLHLNYPKGKRSITDRIFMDRYLTEEADDLPTWTLADEEKTIFGYKCMKATTTLYGRIWTAWYAQEISRTDGPWLLRGLPGVVVMAEEETGKFRFELQRIEHRETPILYQVKDYIKTDRNSVLKQKQKYYKNQGQFIMGTAAGAQTSRLSSSEEVPYDPIRKIQD
ncbi:GLPGLI family protein [Porphyromonas cangingivalis]|uniref:GLPGLI family protein n=1 Tax=Porphyromonas cangingivalis TaxID=36874 RepID=UPI00068AC2B1|nr:GLPGLI family protein [Porphyromonas cangingivalis]